MKNDLRETVRAACLWLPETDEVSSHGSPNFRVRGKTFASFVVNHHGDGRVALWLNLPTGAQDWYVSTASPQFFVPPYVGSRGWLGVHLDKGLSWGRIAALVREAYEKVAPTALTSTLGKTPRINAPARKLARSEIDPFRSARFNRSSLTACGRCQAQGAHERLHILRRNTLAPPPCSLACDVWRGVPSGTVGLPELRVPSP